MPKKWRYAPDTNTHVSTSINNAGKTTIILPFRSLKMPLFIQIEHYQ